MYHSSFVLRIIICSHIKMVVNTRSKHQRHLQQELSSFQEKTDEIHVHITGGNNGGDTGSKGRRVTIVTPSLIDASVRTYKVYSPLIKPPSTPEHETTNNTKKKNKKNKKKHNNKKKFSSEIMGQEAAEVVDAADALVSLLQYDDDTEPHTHSSPQSPIIAENGRSIHTCMNPMNPVTKFVYRIGVYNINQTHHYKSAYVLYDPKSRMFHVYTIISNQVPSSFQEESHASTATDDNTAFTLPGPKNTIQTKYTSYINDTISNYISTMIIPSNDFNYYIQDDILGIVVSNDEFREKVFSEDSSYYDVEGIVFDNTSTQTTNGYKTFMLIPSRNFWFSPVGGYYAITDTNTVAYSDHRYTPEILNSVLPILSQSA